MPRRGAIGQGMGGLGELVSPQLLTWENLGDKDKCFRSISLCKTLVMNHHNFLGERTKTERGQFTASKDGRVMAKLCLQPKYTPSTILRIFLPKPKSPLDLKKTLTLGLTN